MQVMKIIVISGSPRKTANTQVMMKFIYEYTKSKNADTVFINLSEGGIDYFRGPNEQYGETTKQAIQNITEADIWLVGTPIYNSFYSSALKNLFEYINYKKTPGKVAGLAILASGNAGFIDVQTLLTQLMSYFRVITNPKAAYMTADKIKDGQIADEDTKARLRTLVNETIALASKLR